MNEKYIKFIIGFGCVILLLSAGIIAVKAQDGQPYSGPSVYIPVVSRGYVGHEISGKVISQQNVPISGVKIQTNRGQSVITNAKGEYALEGLAEGTYTLTPSLAGTFFSPPSSSVVVPPDAVKLNFTADVACSEALINGGFESNSAWEFPVTAYPAGYSTAYAHGGNRSARTGITNPADNVYSYSSTRQLVSIPSNTTSAYLTFWLKSFSGGGGGLSLPEKPPIGSPLIESPMAGDVQYVLVLDEDFNILERLVWHLSNNQAWTKYEFNLTEYKGQAIWLHFGTYNDGAYGIASMFVDDVSLELCQGGSPTPSPTPGPCSNLFDNPSFEWIGDWEIPITAYPAGYSSARAHSGAWSMRTGITYSGDNKYSYSDFRQSVHIPSGAAVAQARFWLYTLSGESKGLAQPEMITPTGRPFEETALSGDVQYVLVLDHNQYWIDTLVWQRSNEGYWHYYEFDLRRYAGDTIYLQFGTYNDGYSGISSMFVDDVSLDDCVTTPTPGPSPTPSYTPTPRPCSELIVNSNFDGTGGWEIPNTVYPAGYSYAQYHSAFRSMRTGIVIPGDNIYSYSDFRQQVTIPANIKHATLGMWIYPLSGEVMGQALPPQPVLGSNLNEIQISGDVQYLLVMDTSYNILDVLIWQLSDSQTWTNKLFDLNNYRGWTILLQWGTLNDGSGGISAMYVDDVTLQACY
jgi:hypothetical protein